MRIGQTNMNISKFFPQRTAFSQPKASTLSASSGYHRNTLEDFLSGHRKNSYGVEGMCATNNPNAKKIIKVSDEMKKRVFNSVKDSFYKYYGMSGDDEAEWETLARAKNDYYKTLKIDDRASAAYTLGQLEKNISKKISNAIKEKVPGWTVGKPVSHDILDEIFSDESLFSSKVNSANTSRNQFDTFI